jgi:hypothetical protein
VLFLCRPGGGKSRLKRNWIALKSTHSCRLASKIDTGSREAVSGIPVAPIGRFLGRHPYRSGLGERPAAAPLPPPASGQRTPGFNSCHKSIVRRSHSGSVSCEVGRRRSCGSCVNVTVSRRNKLAGARICRREPATWTDSSALPFPVSRRPRLPDHRLLPGREGRVFYAGREGYRVWPSI